MMNTDRAAAALKDATTHSVWRDDLRSLASHPPLTTDIRCDLLVVGGGFTGLWTALLAKQQQPELDVVVLESHHLGFGASSRNGGFISESLTHGITHGLELWPRELLRLLELGRENFREIQEFLSEHGIDADLTVDGKTHVATRTHEIAELAGMQELNDRFGESSEILTAEEVQADVHSPTYLGGIRIHSSGGLLNPAKLLVGLVRVAEAWGVRFFENSPAISLDDSAVRVVVASEFGKVTADKVVLATNAFKPLKRNIRLRVMPIFDHVLATERLSEGQLESLGWHDNQGMTDAGNQFHYYRKTADQRIVWGGYDANYYFGNNTSPALEQRTASHELLADHFFTTFPQLEDVRFEYKWAGLIDSTSRFTPFYDLSRSGRVGTVVGFTGLGVCSSRFGAKVILDLLYGRKTEITSLEMVRKKPFPIPPEPLRSPAVLLTRWSLTREDVNGHRNLWLRTLDRFGVGFNS